MTEELKDQNTRRGLKKQRQCSKISNEENIEEDRVRKSQHSDSEDGRNREARTEEWSSQIEEENDFK